MTPTIERASIKLFNMCWDTDREVIMLETAWKVNKDLDIDRPDQLAEAKHLEALSKFFVQERHHMLWG